MMKVNKHQLIMSVFNIYSSQTNTSDNRVTQDSSKIMYDIHVTHDSSKTRTTIYVTRDSTKTMYDIHVTHDS